MAGTFAFIASFVLGAAGFLSLVICTNVYARDADGYVEPFHPMSVADAVGQCNGNAPPWQASRGLQKRRTRASNYVPSTAIDQTAIRNDVSAALAATTVTLPDGFFAVEKDNAIVLSYGIPSNSVIGSKAAVNWNLDEKALQEKIDSFNARYDAYCLSHTDKNIEPQPVHQLNVLLDDYTKLMNETIKSMPEEMRVKQDVLPVAKYEDLVAGSGFVATSTVASAGVGASGVPSIGAPY